MPRITHGKSLSKVYRAWRSMLRRCNSPTDPKYEHYGKRGIRVCQEFYRFENFYKVLGDPPSPRHSLDRYPNCNGHYTPENVRWATPEEQQNNHSHTVKYPHAGKSLTIAEWSRELGISYHALNKRLKVLGWTFEDAIQKPKRGWKKS